MTQRDITRIASAINDNPEPHHEIATPKADPAWRFDLWCMAACLLIAAVTTLAIYLKTGSL